LAHFSPISDDDERDGPPPATLADAQALDRAKRLRALDREAAFHEQQKEGAVRVKKTRIPASKRVRVDNALEAFAPSVQRRENDVVVDTLSQVDPDVATARKAASLAHTGAGSGSEAGSGAEAGSGSGSESDEGVYAEMRARAQMGCVLILLGGVDRLVDNRSID
jgi:hypothetical protein